MSDAVSRPEKMSYILVSFRYNGVQVNYTNWGSAIDPNGANYKSVPAIAVQLPPNTGSIQTQLAKVTMPIVAETTAFLEPLSRGTPFPPVEATIVEVNRGLNAGDKAQILTLFRGWVRVTVKNPSNKRGFVRLEIQSPKSALGQAVGIGCNHECENTLYQSPCSKAGFGGWGPQANTERKLGVLSVINGKTVTVTGSVGLTGGKSYYNGYMSREGANIRIRRWDSGSVNTFYLSQQPPVEWLGQQVAVFPGCDKSIETCRDVWNNEESFNGVGYAIPAFDPNIELPGDGEGGLPE